MPFTSAETVRRGRLGPGRLLLVDPGRRRVEDAEAKARILRLRSTTTRGRRTKTVPRGAVHDPTLESPQLRYLAGLDAERARLDIKTMALEAHEPL